MARKAKRRYYNYSQVFLDSMTIFFGIMTIIAAVVTFIDFSSNIKWSPLIFGLASAMSVSLAVKSFRQKDRNKTIFRIMQAVLLAVVCIVVLIATR